MVKEQRVGLYIMPDTRNKLNLIKAMISMQVGRPLNQDETISRLIQIFERQHNQGNAPHEVSHANAN